MDTSTNTGSLRIIYVVAAGVVVIVLVLIVAAGCMILTCFLFRRLKPAGDDIIPLGEVVRLNPPNKDPTLWEGLPHEVSTFGHNISLEISKFQEVPLEQLEAHISKNGTDLEYEQIKSADIKACMTTACLAANALKNRYNNILPNEETRVLLKSDLTIQISDYINANFITGYSTGREYIACQGPLQNTLDDFWQMVWEQRTHTIVMVTNLVEKGVSKCAEYWPTGGPSQYGVVEVAPLEERKYQDYIRRTFSISLTDKISDRSTRKVKQFHFIAWPDFGVPSEASSMMKFVYAVRSEVLQEHGPMVVHCSAGVGRTGTFIATDVQLQRLSAKRPLNVQEYVCQMRAERSSCVQTKEQYRFIYEVLLHAMLYGNTQLSAQQLKDGLPNLSERVDKEFQLLLDMSAKGSSLASVALQSENMARNRSPHNIPLNKNRVVLEGGAGSNSYINASWIEGFSRQPEFIMTQHPLKHTVGDLWMMVLQKKVSTVVMIGPLLSDVDMYWPEVGMEVLYDRVVVKAVSRQNIPDHNIVMRTFHISSEELNTQQVVTHFQLCDWPAIGLPSTDLSVMSLVKQFELHRATNGGITAVHSSSCLQDEAAGVYIALDILCAQLTCEEGVDVFGVVGALRGQHHSLVPLKDQYKFIYETLINKKENFVITSCATGL